MLTSWVVLFALFPTVTAELRAEVDGEAQVDAAAQLFSGGAMQFGLDAETRGEVVYYRKFGPDAETRAALKACGVTLSSFVSQRVATLILNKVKDYNAAEADDDLDIFTSLPLVTDGRVNAGVSAVVVGSHVFLYDDASLKVWVNMKHTDPTTRTPLEVKDIIGLTADPAVCRFARAKYDSLWTCTINDSPQCASFDTACRRESQSTCDVMSGGVCEFSRIINQCFATIHGRLSESSVNNHCRSKTSRSQCESMIACEYVGPLPAEDEVADQRPDLGQRPRPDQRQDFGQPPRPVTSTRGHEPPLVFGSW